MAELTLYNTLTRKKELFSPLDETNIRMYACGPTVYDRPHLGNARAVVVYDVLFRLLKALYGEKHVTYARNITDVDDKINKAAKENGETIQQLTSRITDYFHADMEALNCELPTHEPRATDFVNEQGGPADKKDHMVAMIQRLIDQNHAYATDDGHVLFDVTTYDAYGKLSGRTVEEQQAGARIAVEDYKKNPGDFVLWKPASSDDDPSSVFDSPWSQGRPGWHIECSVMSTNFLGESYDIHGGGADLKFPHHENEIAQACCANSNSSYANYWVHNGFLTVEGEKMSKSLGNFTTVRELLDKGIKGEVIRYVFLMTHYRSPLDWNKKSLYDATKSLNWLYTRLEIDRQQREVPHSSQMPSSEYNELKKDFENNKRHHMSGFYDWMCNDLNTSNTLSYLRNSLGDGSNIREKSHLEALILREAVDILGICQLNRQEWEGETLIDLNTRPDLEMRLEARAMAKKEKNFELADQIRDELLAQGYEIIDKRDGDPEVRRINTI